MILLLLINRCDRVVSSILYTVNNSVSIDVIGLSALYCTLLIIVLLLPLVNRCDRVVSSTVH